MPRRPPRPSASRRTRGGGGRREAAPSRSAFTLHGDPGADGRENRLAPALALLLAGFLGAALLAVALGPHRIGDYSTETDFYGGYAEGARRIQGGHLDPARYGVVGPGYEVALALAGLVTRDLFLAAELLSVTATVATVLLWFHLLRRRANAWLALLATLVMAANPHLFRFGYTASTDALALALQAGALFLLLARAGTRSAALAGLVAAAAFLTRYTAVVLLPVGLIVAAAGGRAAGGGGPAAAGHAGRSADPPVAGEAAPTGSGRGREALAFAGGFLVPVALWTGYCLAGGAGFAFQLHHNLAYEVFARARGIGWDAYQRDLQPLFPTPWSVIAHDPLAVLQRVAANAAIHLREDARVLLGWPTALCAGLGALLAVATGALRRGWPLALAWALGFLALVPVFHSERYGLMLLPFYAAAAATLFVSPRFALVAGGRLWLKPWLVLVPLAFACAASVDLQRRVLAQQPLEALEGARALRGLAAPGDRVIARKPHVAHLAGLGAVAFPFADSLAGLAEHARTHRARWLFFGFPESEARPAFRHLLDATGTVPGLTARAVLGPRPAVLYEIGPEFGRRPAWFDNDTLVNLHQARATLRAYPDSVPMLRLAGTIELARGDLAAARGHLERAADLSPHDPDLLLPLGETLLRLGDLRLADLAYARAGTVSPGNVQARVGRGWVSLLAGREREAAERWRPVIAATRNAATLEQMLALYRRLGDAAAAAEVEAALRGLGR